MTNSWAGSNQAEQGPGCVPTAKSCRRGHLYLLRASTAANAIRIKDGSIWALNLDVQVLYKVSDWRENARAEAGVSREEAEQLSRIKKYTTLGMYAYFNQTVYFFKGLQRAKACLPSNFIPTHHRSKLAWNIAAIAFFILNLQRDSSPDTFRKN